MDLALNLGVVLAYKLGEIIEFMHLILMLQSRFTHSEIYACIVLSYPPLAIYTLDSSKVTPWAGSF